MIKVLEVTHKQLYFSKINGKYSSIGGFSIWHNYLSKHVKELHILSPIKSVEYSPRGGTYLDDRIKVHHGLVHQKTDVLKAIMYTLRVARTYNVDIVICKIPDWIGTAGVVGSWLSRKPTVLHIVGDWVEFAQIIRINVLVKMFMSFFVRFLLILSCSLSNAVITQSIKIRDSLMRLGVNARKISVILESSVDNAFFRAPRKMSTYDCKTILYVGRLSSEKGLLILIKAVHLLKKTYGHQEGFKLVILGDGKVMGALKGEIKEYGMDGMVELKGFVPHGEVINYLNNCYVLVLPSLTEGNPKVLMEAMAATKPIVATCVGGIPEIVKDGVNGLLVRPNDASDLAEALHKLLKDESLSIKLGEEGRRRAEKYKLERIIPLYISSITRILGKTSRT
jgi:glycosyltransferase involved in cell wall biosynthesis